LPIDFGGKKKDPVMGKLIVCPICKRLSRLDTIKYVADLQSYSCQRRDCHFEENYARPTWEDGSEYLEAMSW
jgi:hypothetical protein